jgi:undecaprenyl-diphosphatase
MSEELKAIVLGLVQGLTEFFPISSSAHLSAMREILGFSMKGLAFDVSLHLATLLAVLVYFRGEILRAALAGNRWQVLLRIVLATLPAVIAGFLLGQWRENLPPGYAVGGWLFSATYLLLTRGRGGAIPYGEAPVSSAVTIGLAQSLAIFPGVSRSGSTIASGLWLGLSREDAAKFSFLLAIPAIGGAGLLEGLKVLKSGDPQPGLLGLAAIAMPVSFVAGMFTIHFLLRVVKSDFFHRFGWYNLCAAVAFGAYILAQASPASP